MAIAGGRGNDELTGGGGPDVLSGGAGNDTLTGLAARRVLRRHRRDVVHSRDGIAERLACGNGNDRADNDFTDILAECERGRRRRRRVQLGGRLQRRRCRHLPRRRRHPRERRRRGLRRGRRPQLRPRRRRLHRARRLRRRERRGPARARSRSAATPSTRTATVARAVRAASVAGLDNWRLAAATPSCGARSCATHRGRTIVFRCTGGGCRQRPQCATVTRTSRGAARTASSARGRLRPGGASRWRSRRRYRRSHRTRYQSSATSAGCRSCRAPGAKKDRTADARLLPCAGLAVALVAPAAASATAIPVVRGSTMFFDGRPAGAATASPSSRQATRFVSPGSAASSSARTPAASSSGTKTRSTARRRGEPDPCSTSGTAMMSPSSAPT